MSNILTHTFIGAAIVSSATVSGATTQQISGLLRFPVASDRITLTESKPLSGHFSTQDAAQGTSDMVAGSSKPETTEVWAYVQEPWLNAASARLLTLSGDIHTEVKADLQQTAYTAVKEANLLLLKLESAGLGARPAMGWDDDGTLSIFVSVADFTADISVLGDGSFSFSAKRGSRPAVTDQVAISGPLPAELVALLA